MRFKSICVFTVSLIALIVLGFIDYYTGYELGFFVFYFIPVSFTSWFSERKLGITIAFLAAVAWYISDVYSLHHYSRPYLVYWETFIRLVSFLTTALTISTIKHLKMREGHLKSELERTNGELARMKNDK